MWVSVILVDDYETTTINLNVGKCVLVKEVDTTPNRKKLHQNLYFIFEKNILEIYMLPFIIGLEKVSWVIGLQKLFSKIHKVSQNDQNLFWVEYLQSEVITNRIGIFYIYCNTQPYYI